MASLYILPLASDSRAKIRPGVKLKYCTCTSTLLSRALNLRTRVGNYECDGGEDYQAYNWIMKNGGLAAEEDYEYLDQVTSVRVHCHRATKPISFLKCSGVHVFTSAGWLLQTERGAACEAQLLRERHSV